MRGIARTFAGPVVRNTGVLKGSDITKNSDRAGSRGLSRYKKMDTTNTNKWSRIFRFLVFVVFFVCSYIFVFFVFLLFSFSSFVRISLFFSFSRFLVGGPKGTLHGCEPSGAVNR